MSGADAHDAKPKPAKKTSGFRDVTTEKQLAQRLCFGNDFEFVGRLERWSEQPESERFDPLEVLRCMAEKKKLNLVGGAMSALIATMVLVVLVFGTVLTITGAIARSTSLGFMPVVYMLIIATSAISAGHSVFLWQRAGRRIDMVRDEFGLTNA